MNWKQTQQTLSISVHHMECQCCYWRKPGHCGNFDPRSFARYTYQLPFSWCKQSATIVTTYIKPLKVEYEDNGNAVREYLGYENFGGIELDGEGSGSATMASAETDDGANEYDSDKLDNAYHAQEYPDSENSGESKDGENSDLTKQS